MHADITDVTVTTFGDDMDDDQERGLIPKWAEPIAMEIFREVAADFKRLVDHLTKEPEEKT